MRQRKSEKSQRATPRGTYKLEQERVFSQRSNATGKPKDEHDAAHHEEEPDRVEAPQVSDGRDVGENTLEAKEIKGQVLKGSTHSKTTRLNQLLLRKGFIWYLALW